MKKLYFLVLAVLLWTTPALAVDRTFSWTDNSNNEDGFILQSCPGVCATPAWVEVARTTPGVTTLRVAATPLTSYRVVAFNLGGDSAPSNVVLLSNVPGAPTGFTIGP